MSLLTYTILGVGAATILCDAAQDHFVDVPAILMSAALALMIATLVVVLTSATLGITWKIVGRTLAPVEAIRAQLDEICMTDLSRCVLDAPGNPPGNDEIARMTRPVNETLHRLQTLVERQRQFSADLANELCTPIAALRVTLEDAATYPDDTDVLAAFRTALQQTERLESLVSDLLLLARLRTGMQAARRRIDLAELVATGVSGRDDRIRSWLTPGVVVTGVPAQLTRLLDNLLDNARRYADDVIEVEVRREGESAVLAVADDGPGIRPADQEWAFEEFTRLDTACARRIGGAGLGLSIARGIAHAHDGTILIEDSPRGARFVLRIPAQPEPLHRGSV
jgi:signal transduction histidine kinase